IPASQQAFASCVSNRESHGNPRAKSSLSSSAGKWQFLQSQWGQSLPWMISARLRDFGMPGAEARRIRIYLQRTPIHHWSEQLQDVGFIAVLNARGPWSGWRHWYLSGSRCNAIAGAR
ncbi:MAG: hypothetical protein ACR2JS_04955, partial [Candidatus Nanopelagicales bacterium]